MIAKPIDNYMLEQNSLNLFHDKFCLLPQHYIYEDLNSPRCLEWKCKWDLHA